VDKLVAGLKALEHMYLVSQYLFEFQPYLKDKVWEKLEVHREP
jgi:hypothetical protein